MSTRWPKDNFAPAPSVIEVSAFYALLSSCLLIRSEDMLSSASHAAHTYRPQKTNTQATADRTSPFHCQVRRHELLDPHATKHVADIYGPVCPRRNIVRPAHLAVVVAKAAPRR